MAIENAKLYEQLRLYADELEVTDHLTQLFTFFHFKKLLQGESRPRAGLGAAGLPRRVQHRELRPLQRTPRDTDTATTCSGAWPRPSAIGARKQDIIGRCFGSTFAVVFPGTPEEDASGRVALMRDRLEGLGYPGEEALPEGRLRFRWAVAAYTRGEGSTAEDFVSQVVEKSKNPAA